MSKQTANIIFLVLLILSVFITWKAVGYASSLAFAGEQPNLWINAGAFFASVCIVGVAIYVKYKYGQ